MECVWIEYGRLAVNAICPHAGLGIILTPADSTLVCPSSQDPVVQWAYTDGQWGNMVWSNYMYMGGLTTKNINGAGNANWGTVNPAVHQYDDGNSTSVLAADEVYWDNGHTSLENYQGGAISVPHQPSRPA